MKAIITRQNADGSFDGVGTNNRVLTGHYKLLRNLIKHGVPEHFKNRECRFELYHNSIIFEDEPFKTFTQFIQKEN